jgi:hypothetical protein
MTPNSEQPSTVSRILQSEPQNFGDYEINAKYSKSCSDFSREDMVYTEVELNTTITEINQNFEFAYPQFERFLKTNDTVHLEETFEEASGKVAPFLLIVLVLLVLLPCVCAYFLCDCRCICCDGDSEIHDHDDDSEQARQDKEQRRQRRA